jgi:hypothetical protein
LRHEQGIVRAAREDFLCREICAVAIKMVRCKRSPGVSTNSLTCTISTAAKALLAIALAEDVAE